MEKAKASDVRSITRDAVSHPRYGQFFKRALPPIMREKDRTLLRDVQKFIEKENKKIGCLPDVYDAKRFAIYSAALNRIIEHVTVYKDILADTKREYEECISAITNGQKESFFLRKKIKTLANLPTTIAGYERRKSELEEKLKILNDDNDRLQHELDNLRSSDDKPDVVEEQEKRVVTPVEFDENRPIPGLTVGQWTDPDVLVLYLTKLDSAIEDLTKQQKTAYVPISMKNKSEETLEQRVEARDRLILEVKKLHRQKNALKLAMDSVHAYRRKKAEYPDFEQSLGEFMINKLTREEESGRRISWINDDGELAYDDDDPTKEKEAEMILEYIDKFNELFNEQEYDKAAVHAANSPRGVLRVMETLNRFRDVSVDFEGTPSPLLLYSVALMNSSTAQCHVAEKDMSIVCARCALDENRPDLVKHWATAGCITPCNEIAESLVEYGKKVPEYKSLCLVVAHKIYTDINNHHEACVTLFHLHYFNALVDYATNTAGFTKSDYLNLIRACPDGILVWSLCRPLKELTVAYDASQQIAPVNNALPLRFDQAICAMLDSTDDGKKVAVRFLDDLYTGSLVSWVLGEEGRADTMHSIVYEETDGDVSDDSESDWLTIMHFSELNDLDEVAMEIKCSVEVKKAICRAIQTLANAGKEEFDYYT